MSTLPWTPWHKVVQLRDDLKSGELSLAAFAADLYDVALQRGRRRVYEDPSEFFALTYPTYNLRELAKDVVLRLAGKNDKAVRQLELTYGGGKTHTLITLYHLANDPAALPDLPAVQEFVQHIGIRPPQARVAVLSFDKLDVEKGMEVRGPDGMKRWLKTAVERPGLPDRGDRRPAFAPRRRPGRRTRERPRGEPAGRVAVHPRWARAGAS